jgi:penicillin-binding protein 1B
MTKKTSPFLIRGILYSGLALLLACGWFLYRGQQRLLDLVGRTSQKSTEVYSRWLPLSPGDSITWGYITGTLGLLGYERVQAEPQKPGQYRASPPSLEIWTRGFEFPDQPFPAQRLLLSFSDQTLRKVETLPDKKEVESWRLEPKRLARWAAKGGASQPQIHIGELPAYVPMAVVAIEDKRFFQHGAIDVRGLARAIWIDIREGSLRQGGSTLTQQLSRSIFLDIRRTWSRKLLEAGLAFFLEAVYTKQQLLEMYLNQVYWGQDGMESLLGLESASRSFFGKSARELTLGESALLAGLLQSPNHYSPRANLEVARERRNLVLALMRTQELISEDQLKTAVKEPIRLVSPKTRAGEAPYFVSTLQEALLQDYSFAMLMTQGWRIFTTLDPLIQAYAASALRPSEGQAALVAIDPRTGGVRAWVGGTSYGKSTFDRVVYAHRQPGSAFKPFVVLAALDTRKATMATMLEDKPVTLKTLQGPWSPQNYDRKYKEKASVWDMLVYSLNVPAVHLTMLAGPESVADYAKWLGVRSPLRAVPSLALGTSEVTVLELTSAYATLANAGMYAAPYSIETVIDSNKEAVQSHTVGPLRVVSEMSSYLVTLMLQAVLEEGTGRFARQMGFTYKAAGKTGTSENYQDAWFVGYTPRLACGVWVGHDQPKSLGRAAAGIALPIWSSFMQKSLALWPEEGFPEPKGLSWKTIDKDSGELARSGCVNRRKEAFLPGTEPDRPCSLHPGGIRGFFYRLKNKPAASVSTDVYKNPGNR